MIIKDKFTIKSLGRIKIAGLLKENYRYLKISIRYRTLLYRYVKKIYRYL